MSLPPQPCWIHSLPTELISIILRAAIALDSERGLECYTSRKGAAFPMIAQRVCRRWRIIVCDTPALWVFLDIRRSRTANYPLYVQRSRAFGLQVRLEILPPGPTAEFDMRRLRQVDLLISKHAHRIHKLVLKGEKHGDTKEYVEGLRDKLPNLRELVISGGPYTQSEPQSGLDLVTPQLRSLSVDLGWLNWDPMPVAPDLEELYVGDLFKPIVITSSLFTKALQAYPHLRRLELHYPRIDGDGETPSMGLHLPAPLVLGSLEELVLQRVSMAVLDRVLRLLGVPRLQKLQVEGDRYGTNRAPRSMPVLRLPLVETLLLKIEPQFALGIAKQLPSLKHLEFRSLQSSPRGMDGALEALASHWRTLPEPIPLKTLCTRGISPATLLALLGDGGGKAVPSLRKVSVYYADIVLSEGQKVFAAHAEARTRISALVELDIWGLSRESMDARMRVRSLEEEDNWRTKFSIFENAAW